MRVLSVFLGGGLATPYWKTSLFLSCPFKTFSSPEMHVPLNNRFLLRLSQYIRTFCLKPHLWVITDVCLIFSLSSLSFFKYLMDVGASFAPMANRPFATGRGFCAVFLGQVGRFPRRAQDRMPSCFLDCCASWETTFPSACPDTWLCCGSALLLGTTVVLTPKCFEGIQALCGPSTGVS